MPRNGKSLNRRGFRKTADSMELLSPAGNVEKLYYAYAYGADAAYIGLSNFSLRAKADNFTHADAAAITALKGNKKLYCALNIYFHHEALRKLEDSLDEIAAYPFDAFIISDIGIVPRIKKRFPGVRLHVSTQANCVNGEAAKLYRDLGFSRIIVGREVSLKEIETIKNTVPDMELEGFVHGAMCLAYSGRCFLSAYMAGRSGNTGDCAHSCRWEYRLIEESERPGEYYPVIEEDGYTTILSSKDLCMIDYISELRDSGLDSVKIEGRMKSVYYTAVVTRAYRKMIDSVVFRRNVPDVEAFREELFHISHREYSTGFYFGTEEIEQPARTSYIRTHILAGTVREQRGDGRYLLSVKNSIYTGDTIEYIGPDIVSLPDSGFRLFDAGGEETDAAHHGRDFYIETDKPLRENYIIRKKL